MSTLSPLRSQIAVFGGREIPDAAIEQLRERIDHERSQRAEPLPLEHDINVCLHVGPHAEALGARRVVHVNVDLPEIVVSPVIDAPGAICLSCYQRRRQQHNVDPRLEDTGSMPLLRPDVAGLPITGIGLAIVARRVLGAIEGWVAQSERRFEFSLYRTSLNQLSIGRVVSHANCDCGTTNDAAVQR